MRHIILVIAALPFLFGASPLLFASGAPSTAISVPDDGWRLWLDRSAQWQGEPAFLPGDADLAQITPHPPTGGWQTLSTVPSKVVSLPTTVEQHFWGVGGLRPYKNEYFYEDRDNVPRNGNYIGVSWWWRTLDVPQNFAGKTAILHIRGAKQRAEVYVNQKLVGYGFIAETAFDCDVTSALLPGRQNTIAIRITNPGGRLDWGDWGTATLGKVSFYAGHAFGGLDRGITLSAHGPVRLTDAWVLNTPEPRTVDAHAIVFNSETTGSRESLRATVIDPRTGKAVATATQTVTVPAQGEQTVSIRMGVPSARLWDLDNPNLYRMHFEVVGAGPANAPSLGLDTRDTTFGFRWFGPSGVGSHAVLRLNGSRIRIYSAICWGFYGPNGLWPTPMLAEKEVRVAKSIGLNALNFHRNIARTEALDAADRLGLLRYTEPGGGMTLFWNKADPQNTLQRYMTEKIVHMVRDHRSHPSLMMYIVQNELDDTTYKLPQAEAIVRTIHQEDPSRLAILKSGINPVGEMWMMPYDNTLYVDKGDGTSGWWDDHSVGTPDSWTDQNYQGPDSFVYRSPNQREIIDFGEMGGSGAADNHALMVAQIKKLGGESYDLLDHEEVDAAYNRFLDQYHFRSAFPTSSDLYRQIGAKQYEYWRNVLQCARLNDDSDYLTVSGWETTAVEDHGGLVDNLRNPHGDPSVIHEALQPILPAVQLRKTALACGETATYDLFFLNETNHPVRGQLVVKLVRPSGAVQELGAYPVPAFKTDVFSYLVAAGLKTPPLDREGDYRLTFSLGNISESRTIYVVNDSSPSIGQLALLGNSGGISQDLSDLGQSVKPFTADSRFAIAVCAADPDGTLSSYDTPVTNTDDPDLYKNQRFGRQGGMAFCIAGLPNGPANVTLGFDEAYFTSVGSRVFDVNINGRTALKDLDVFAKAGGMNRVWTTTVDAEVVDGKILVEPGMVKSDNAMFSTIRIDAGGKTVAQYFGDKPYTAKDGTVWQPYSAQADVPDALLDKVRAGMGLLVVSDQDQWTTQFAQKLAAAGAFKFDGLVGRSFAPWMGSWYFVRAHPLYAGLPVNTVMKGDYQVSVSSSNGLLVSGPSVEIITAFSRDHSRQIGAGDVLTRLGKGKILFHVLPRMNDAFQKRWLANALRLLADREP